MPLQQVEPVKENPKVESKKGKMIRYIIGAIAVIGLIAIFVAMALKS